MANKGFSHVGLATRDLERTKEFYESILGFKTLLIDVIDVQEGGQIRHLIMDAGRAVGASRPSNRAMVVSGVELGGFGSLSVAGPAAERSVR
jgi:catechol 2,3-dioxygenase-like lactoylglutathione lyase family enzyme